MSWTGPQGAEGPPGDPATGAVWILYEMKDMVAVLVEGHGDLVPLHLCRLQSLTQSPTSEETSIRVHLGEIEIA